MMEVRALIQISSFSCQSLRACSSTVCCWRERPPSWWYIGHQRHSLQFLGRGIGLPTISDLAVYSANKDPHSARGHNTAVSKQLSTRSRPRRGSHGSRHAFTRQHFAIMPIGAAAAPAKWNGTVLGPTDRQDGQQSIT